MYVPLSLSLVSVFSPYLFLSFLSSLFVFVYLSIYLSSIHLVSIYLSIYLSIYPSIYLSMRRTWCQGAPASHRRVSVTCHEGHAWYLHRWVPIYRCAHTCARIYAYRHACMTLRAAPPGGERRGGGRANPPRVRRLRGRRRRRGGWINRWMHG